MLKPDAEERDPVHGALAAPWRAVPGLAFPPRPDEAGQLRGSARHNQHFVGSGPVGRLRHDDIDILTKSPTSWTDRHNRWATLEAAARMAADSHMQVQARRPGSPVERKRFQRAKVDKSFPIFARPRARPALPRLGHGGRQLSMAGERRLPIGGRRASSWGQRCP